MVDAETGSRRRNPPPTILMVVAEKGGMPGLIVNQGAVEPRDWANAHLIAAAPELLEALKDILRIARAANLGISGHAPRFAKAQAAIAKAEGA